MQLTNTHVREVSKAHGAALKSLCRILRQAGFSIVQQIELSRDFADQLAPGTENCTLLLVDNPLSMFEAIALDRSAAAFVPFHVVVTGDRHSTRIHWAHPAAAVGLCLSPTAKASVDALYTRLTQLLMDSEP